MNYLSISILICTTKVCPHVLQESGEFEKLIKREAVLARFVREANHAAKDMIWKHKAAFLEGSREFVLFKTTTNRRKINDEGEFLGKRGGDATFCLCRSPQNIDEALLQLVGVVVQIEENVPATHMSDFLHFF